MLPCASVEDYFGAPVGRYFGGESFLHFYLDPKLDGLLIFGRPDEHDARLLARILEVEALPAWLPEASLIDARRMEGLDATAFAVIGRYLTQRWRRRGRIVTREAIVRPPNGLAGALVAGFYDVHPHPSAWKVFTGVPEALAWLGRDPAPLLAALDELQAVAAGAPPLVRGLRDRLAARPAGATLAAQARALGISPRVLQRQLRQAGTSFRAELHAARLKLAQTLLRDTDAKLTAIALEVGCASLQHFSGFFHRLTGESPAVWRRRRR